MFYNLHNMMLELYFQSSKVYLLQKFYELAECNSGMNKNLLFCLFFFFFQLHFFPRPCNYIIIDLIEGQVFSNKSIVFYFRPTRGVHLTEHFPRSIYP